MEFQNQKPQELMFSEFTQNTKIPKYFVNYQYSIFSEYH